MVGGGFHLRLHGFRKYSLKTSVLSVKVARGTACLYINAPRIVFASTTSIRAMLCGSLLRVQHVRIPHVELGCCPSSTFSREGVYFAIYLKIFPGRNTAEFTDCTVLRVLSIRGCQAVSSFQVVFNPKTSGGIEFVRTGYFHGVHILNHLRNE